MSTPHKCPCCDGDGKRWPSWQEDRGDNEPPQCQACHGSGMVWSFSAEPSTPPPAFKWPQHPWPGTTPFPAPYVLELPPQPPSVDPTWTQFGGVTTLST